MKTILFLRTALTMLSLALLPTTQLAAQSHQSRQNHHGADHSFKDAEAWAKKFDDAKRDASQMPQEVIQALQLKPNAIVADIGAGTGYFATRFARALPQGKVFGVDAEPDMVKYLSARAKREGIGNLTAVAAEPGNPRLPEKTDLIVLVNTYHHIDKRENYFRTLQDSLRPGGRVAIIDFRMDAAEGPSPKMRIAQERVRKEMMAAGYALAQEHGFLPNQYFLVFEPAKK